MMTDRGDTIVDDLAILAAFHEAILVVGRDRRVIGEVGASDQFFSGKPSTLVGTAWEKFVAESAEPEHVDALYWAIEALFEHYIPQHFFPARVPLRDGLVVQFALLDDDRVVARIVADPSGQIDRLLHSQVRLALSATIGFADVILKGIGGPLTDIQVEDMQVIQRDSQFALDLISDLRAEYVTPGLKGPVPCAIDELLTLTGDDLSHRQLTTQHLDLDYELPSNTWVYSNGTIRVCLANVVRLLTQYAARRSQIVISAHPHDEVMIVAVRYHAADSAMQVLRHIEPVDLSRRESIKQSERIFTVLSSLNAYLSAWGCTAWAEPGPMPAENVSSIIFMTVPLWKGPGSRA